MSIIRRDGSSWVEPTRLPDEHTENTDADPGDRADVYERPQRTTSYGWAMHAPVVYYAESDGLIKIGCTTNLMQRASTLTPERFLAVEDGDFEVESSRHGQFAHLLAKGKEWFYHAPDLSAWIESLPEWQPVLMNRSAAETRTWHHGDARRTRANRYGRRD